MFAFLPLLLLCAPPLPAFAQSSPDPAGPAPKALVEVRIHDPAELARLRSQASDFDDHRPPSADGRVVIYADPAERARLRAAGFRLEVLIPDLSAWYANRAALDPQPRAGVGSMGGFRTYAEILQEMDRLANTYPALVSPRFQSGTSVQGRGIWTQRLSTTPTVNDPAKANVSFDSLHHAREPMGAEAELEFEDWLCTHYGSDPVATRLLESRNILFTPCVNPDGYEYNRQTNPNGGGMWRKNRRNNGGGSYGVDLNRNYGWEWGPQWSGSSGNPNSDVYRGTAPFSEPETAAMRDLLNQEPPVMSVSAHTYSNLWLYPWGYDTVYTPDDAAFRAYAARMTAENGWSYGTDWEVLYTANGVSDDDHYGNLGTWAFTAEIGSASDGFWPAPSRIPALFQAALPAFQRVAMWSGGWAEVLGPRWSEVSGDGDADIEAGETWSLSVDLDNAGAGAVSGRSEVTSPNPGIQFGAAFQNLSVPAQSNGATLPVDVSFAPGLPSGVPLSLELTLDYGGSVSVVPFTVTLGRARLLALDDMEVSDFGWTVSNATNWSWERAVPERTTTGGTTAQPGNDDPAGSGTHCWVTGAAAGSSVGANDVDGTTWLTSPRFSADGLDNLELEYARWFANLPGSAQDDRLLVQISNDDGATWTTLEEIPNANSWQTVRFALQDYLTLTDAMRLRLRAMDQPNNDITEACLDDLSLRTVRDLPSFGVWGEPLLGTSIDFFLDGPPSVSWSVLWSFLPGPGQVISGVAGEYLLSGGPKVLLSGQTDANGQSRVSATVPNDPALAGRKVYLQAVYDYGGSAAAFSNRATVAIH